MDDCIYQAAHTAITELLLQAKPQAGSLFVLGCSTSEVLGAHIGKEGSLMVAQSIWEAINAPLSDAGISIAIQCCEHLNRALVLKRSVAQRFSYDIVSAIPTAKAGGSMAQFAYSKLQDPVLVAHIKADLGLDIGNTLIGMHLRHVAVPLRLSVRQIGQAPIVCAKTRPPLIGGARTVYES